MIEKPHLRYHFFKLIVCVVLSILVFIFREQLVHLNNLKFFIGALMVAYGLDEIAFEVYCHKLHFIHEHKTYLGLVELVLGSTMLFLTLDYEAVCIIWATWSIIRESYEIKELVTEIRSITLTIISGIESIAVIILSIMLIAEPGEHHALIHIYLLLFEFILTPLVPLVDEFIKQQKLKQKELNEE